MLQFSGASILIQDAIRSTPKHTPILHARQTFNDLPSLRPIDLGRVQRASVQVDGGEAPAGAPQVRCIHVDGGPSVGRSKYRRPMMIRRLHHVRPDDQRELPLHKVIK